MFRSKLEPTIDEIMRDPTVRALMKADRVDVVKFETSLLGLARAIRQESGSPALSRGGVPGGRFPLPSPAKAPAAAARHCWC